MLRPRLAINTYGLTVIVSAWAYFMGHFGIGTYKYGGYLGVMAMNALVFNQYTPVPGSHGSAQFYAARVCPCCGDRIHLLASQLPADMTCTFTVTCAKFDEASEVCIRCGAHWVRHACVSTRIDSRAWLADTSHACLQVQ